MSKTTELNNVLYVEGAGWEKADMPKNTDIENPRIRTRFKNKNGREIYFEAGVMSESSPKFKQGLTGFIMHCFYNNCNEKSKARKVETEIRYFKYTKEGLCQILNSELNCNFKSVTVINDGSYCVHGDNRTYNIYKPIIKSCEVMTRKDWETSFMKDVKPFLNDMGQAMIDKEIFENFLNCMPPIMHSNCYQMSEPYDHNSRGLPMYMTFQSAEGNYYFLGVMTQRRAAGIASSAYIKKE